MKLATFIMNPFVSWGSPIGHLLKCRATVVSLSWAISVKCPWNRVRIR